MSAKKHKFNPTKTSGNNRDRILDNVQYELRALASAVASSSAFQSEYGAGQLVRDAATKDPFILIIEKDEVTGTEQQCALYPGGSKVCPAPAWELIDDANATIDWEAVCYDDTGTIKLGWLVRETIGGTTRIILEEEDGTFVTDTAPYNIVSCNPVTEPEEVTPSGEDSYTVQSGAGTATITAGKLSWVLVNKSGGGATVTAAVDGGAAEEIPANTGIRFESTYNPVTQKYHLAPSVTWVTTGANAKLLIAIKGV